VKNRNLFGVGQGVPKSTADRNTKGSLSFRKTLRVKVRRSGAKKPTIEILKGDDFHYETGTWRKRDRVIDKEKDLYHKTIRDRETGEILYECKEPLSKHQNRGSAKKKTKGNSKLS
jgi:hypothetical protein